MVGSGDCKGLLDMASIWAGVEPALIASCLSAEASPCCGLAVIGSLSSSGIDERRGTSTLRDVSGGDADSVNAIEVDGATGLGGQLLTPPACTVLHQGQ